MRNISQYPLNEQDIKTALQNAIEKYTAERNIGSMDGLALHTIASFFDKPENMQKLLVPEQN